MFDSVVSFYLFIEALKWELWRQLKVDHSKAFCPKFQSARGWNIHKENKNSTQTNNQLEPGLYKLRKALSNITASTSTINTYYPLSL